MKQVRYECSQCTHISCNKQAAEQHNRDMHGNCATVYPMRSRSDLIAEISRLKRNDDHLHDTIEKLVTVGARLTAELELQTAMLLDAYGDSTVLDQIVKQAVDAETRACAELAAEEVKRSLYDAEAPSLSAIDLLKASAQWSVSSLIETAILSRLDQRKGEGEC